MPETMDYMNGILHHAAYRQKLHDYLTQSHTEENLDCWTAIQDYKRKPNKTKAIAIIDGWVTNNLANISAGQMAHLANDRVQYAAARDNAQRMNFFKRHWSAGQRNAAANLFDSAEGELKTNMLNAVTNFLNAPEGQAIKLAIDRCNAIVAHLERAGFVGE
jgi:hypothetical protein